MLQRFMLTLRLFIEELVEFFSFRDAGRKASRKRDRDRYLATQRPWLGLERLEEREVYDMGGNTLAAATDLGDLQGSRTIADYVGQLDPNDFYRLRVNSTSDARLALDGLSADADIRLLDSRGTRLASSTRGGRTSELIQRTLEPGTYHVQVFRFGSANTNYRLTVSVTPRQPPAPTDNAGNSLAAARDLGVLSGTRSYTDFVGRADTNDYYRFQLTGRGTLDLGVDQMSADADVQLLDARGNSIASSTLGGNNAERMQRTLEAGVYHVRVYPFGGAETNYRLTLNVQPATPPSPPDGAGNSLAAARDLGTLRSGVTMQDFVGQADTNDYYRFRLDAQSNVRLRMDGMTADADVQILDAQGRVVASSVRGGANAEAIDRVFASGDWFVRIYPFGPINTNYRLSLEAAAVQQGLDLTTMTPIADYDGHLGADYAAQAGQAVLSPVSGRVIDVRAVNGYGTMAVAIEVTLPATRTFISELTGNSISTDRVIVIFGHLRPSRELINNSDADYRFQQGRGELGYTVDSIITVGQRLGYVETHGYEGDGSSGSHVHVTMSNAASVGTGYWQGRGMPTDDLRRLRYIRPELSWSNFR